MSDDSPPLLALTLRKKSFGQTDILGDISLTLAAGQRRVILGRSGVGKSTLLRIIAGLDEDFDGDITRPKRIAMVFQEPTLLLWRSATDNIRLATGVSKAEADIVLVSVGLDGMGARYPGQLSLGQQRRLSLARALAAKPDLLLMDEPFVSLDPATAEQIRDMTLKRLTGANLATLIVTHDLDEARMMADQTIMLSGCPARVAWVAATDAQETSDIASLPPPGQAD